MLPAQHDITLYWELFRQGKEKGFAYFFQLYYPLICTYCNGILKNSGAAEEITGDSFLKLWHNRSVIHSAARIRSWLYSTARNGCIDRIRKESREPGSFPLPEPLEIPDEGTHLEAMIRAEMLVQLHRALNDLPPQCRNIFHKLFVEGKDTATVATELDLSINTIKSQRARGIRLLRLRLEVVLALLLKIFSFQV